MSWLFVGLGNPGLEYTKNRHNVGFMVLDTIFQQQAAWKKKYNAWISMIDVEGVRVMLCKPLSYMNLSGGPVLEIMKQCQIALNKVVVFHDDLEVPFAETRWKRGGGHAGHNGLRNISAQCGSEYNRLRIGIGRPGPCVSVSEFVLSNFSAAESSILVQEVFPRISTGIPFIVRNELHEIDRVLHAVKGPAVNSPVVS